MKNIKSIKYSIGPDKRKNNNPNIIVINNNKYE